MDDAIRTRENRLVNLSLSRRRFGRSRASPTRSWCRSTAPAGSTFGAVVQCGPELAITTVQTSVADTLPPWSWPRAVTLVPSLPRLPNGKTDRRACIALLGATRP